MATEKASLKREWWGPRFWRILHTLAEASGGMTSLIPSNDEADAWKLLLKAQTLVMPCSVCQKHFTEWKIINKLPDFRLILGEERRKIIRHWLWGCHEKVCKLNQKESIGEYMLPELYKKQRLDVPFAELIEMFRLGIQMGTLKYEDTMAWRNAVGKLRSLYGI
jgi:hypothetical protein